MGGEGKEATEGGRKAQGEEKGKQEGSSVKGQAICCPARAWPGFLCSCDVQVTPACLSALSSCLALKLHNSTIHPSPPPFLSPPASTSLDSHLDSATLAQPLFLPLSKVPPASACCTCSAQKPREWSHLPSLHPWRIKCSFLPLAFQAALCDLTSRLSDCQTLLHGAGSWSCWNHHRRRFPHGSPLPQPPSLELMAPSAPAT